jgi:hypothetical protein
MNRSETKQRVDISAPKFQTVAFTITGTAPYMQNKFSQKAKDTMMAKQEAGAKSKGKNAREPKDFDAAFRAAMYVSKDGWNGMPASCFRNAMISACRIAGVVMTRAKLAVFIEADGFDRDEGEPMVRITKGEPRRCDKTVRLETGVCDIHPRPVWEPGWEAVLRVTFDADMFDASDIANLLMRAGMQVGVGEGRPDSKKSNGIGYGTFTISGEAA